MTHRGGNSDAPDPDRMRIGGVAHTRSPGRTESVGPLEAESTQALGSIESSDSVSGLGATEAIAQALASGAIDPVQAKAELIEQTVRAQLPAGADPALVAEIRAEVEALLASDPLLEALLSP